MDRRWSNVTRGRLAAATILVAALCVADGSVAQTAGAAGTGLEATGPEIMSAPALAVPQDGASSVMPAPRAPPVPPAALLGVPKAVPPLAADRPGKLESYIRSNPSLRKAERLRSDPRMSALPQAVQGDFLNEFGTLMFSAVVASRDSLLGRTHALDQEQMELAKRSIDQRINLASFRMEQAALAERMREHTRTIASYRGDLDAYDADLARHGASLADYGRRKTDYESQVAIHNREAGDYARQCTGRPLPPAQYAACAAWQRKLSARKTILDNWKAQLDGEADRLAQAQSDLTARKAALAARRAAIEATTRELDAAFAVLAARGKQLSAEETTLADWQRTLQPQWEFEIKRIDQWRMQLDRFNTRLEQALDQVQAPPPKPAVAAGFTGTWNDADKRVASAALGAIQDAEMRDWIVTHAELNRFKADNFSPITAFDATLRFKDGFFAERNPARRDNLLAFEAGKVFWNRMKDKALANGQTLESWFIAYSGANASMIADMRMAKHGGDDLSAYGDLFDSASQFGHMFRASALKLTRPGASASQPEWDRVNGEFRAQIGPLLRADE